MTVHPVEPCTLPDAAVTRTGRWKMFGVLAMCAAPVIASYVTYYFIRPEKRSNYAEIVSPPRAIPSILPARVEGGETRDLSTMKGQWLLVVVANSACGPECERQLWLQRQLRQTLGREKDRVDDVFFVVDDGPLKPELSKALAADPSLTVLRVPEAAMRQWIQPGPGRAWEDHLYLVDPMGQWMMRTPAKPDPAKFKKDVERLLRASSSWDRAGRS